MNNKTKNTFSLAAIANVSGKKRGTIYHRARVLGIDTKSGEYSAEQAHSLVYYVPRTRINGGRRETLAEEAARLIKTMAKMNEKIGRKTVIAA